MGFLSDDISLHSYSREEEVAHMEQRVIDSQMRLSSMFSDTYQAQRIDHSKASYMDIRELQGRITSLEHTIQELLKRLDKPSILS